MDGRQLAKAEPFLWSAATVRLLRRNGSQRGLEKPAAAIAGSRLDETIGDSGGRLHVSRSGSKQKPGARESCDRCFTVPLSWKLNLR